MRLRESLPSVLLSLAAVTAVRDARADERAECAKAYEQSQRARQEGAVVRALVEADRCAKPTCPDLLRDECTTWSRELRRDVSRIVIHVRGSDGCAADEAVIADSSHVHRDGDSWVVDPGVQQIDIGDPTSPRTKKITFDLRPGERREIDVDFAGKDATCSRPEPRASGFHPPLVSVGLASVGAGFVILGGALGIIGAGKRSDLDDCKPGCSAERLDAVRPYFVIGDTIAAIGLVSIGAAIAVYFAATSSSSPAAKAQGPVRASPGGLSVSF